MKYLNHYTIPFAGLKVGHHRFDFEVDEKFFACFKDSELSKSKIQVSALLEKQSLVMILDLKVEGIVTVPCDRCADPFDLSVEASERIYIKFGDEAMDEDEIIVLEHNEHELKIAQKIYELILLHLPSKRIHEEGKCNKKVLKDLKKFQSADSKKKSDPRWDLLKNIKFN